MVSTSIYLRRIMASGLRFLVMLGLVITLPAHSEKFSVASTDFRTPVVELYTSEGCSSCPPADRWIRKLGDLLGDELHAVPLAFHVDYWNYLGWEDPFSDRKFTERQRTLATINRQRSIYTPEFLVSGAETRGTQAVVESIQAANKDKAELHIGIAVDLVKGDGIIADIDIGGNPGDAVLYLAVYENNIVREIGGGENHGRTLHHDFVVRDFRELSLSGKDNPVASAVIPLDEAWNTGELGLAAMVMDRKSNATLQAVSTSLNALFPGS